MANKDRQLIVRDGPDPKVAAVDPASQAGGLPPVEPFPPEVRAALLDAGRAAATAFQPMGGYVECAHALGDAVEWRDGVYHVEGEPWQVHVRDGVVHRAVHEALIHMQAPVDYEVPAAVVEPGE